MLAHSSATWVAGIASAASASLAAAATAIPASERHRTVGTDSARKTSSLGSAGRPSSQYSARKTGRLDYYYRNRSLDSTSRAHRHCKLGSASLAATARLTSACGAGRTGFLNSAWQTTGFEQVLLAWISPR